MATRGTYKIDGQILYNHHDNYPIGAAAHFIEVIKKYNNLDLFSIIRGMERISKASSKYDGGPEFHYEIKDEQIFCYSVHPEKDALIYHSSGQIEEWINKQILKGLDETDDKNDYLIVKKSKNVFYTVNGLIKEAEEHFKSAITMTNNGQTGNGSSNFKTAFDLFKLLNVDFTKYANIYKRVYVPFFVDAYKHNGPDLFLSYCEVLTEVKNN